MLRVKPTRNERKEKRMISSIGLIGILLTVGILFSVLFLNSSGASGSTSAPSNAVTTPVQNITDRTQATIAHIKAVRATKITDAMRKAAADYWESVRAKMTPAQKMATAANIAAVVTPGGTPDYFGTTPNYALSPLPPVVNITGGNGTGAIAIATVNASQGGVITNIMVINGGINYTSPNVTITAFDGTGANATAAINANGSIVNINVTNGGSGYGGIRKFVDSLPLLGRSGTNDLGQYIPVAVPDNTTYPSDPTRGAPAADYYEIALVQYTEKMHADLNATTLRGYVQIETPAIAAASKHIALNYTNGTPILNAAGAQVYAVDMPQYLGPVIVAQRDRPVRVKFTNYLPTGAGGNLFLPVDTTFTGAGPGPLHVNGTPCDSMKDSTCVNYTQNRATLHLKGGNTPWISDGLPHQWITPAGENTPYPKGVSVYNVPDMPDPGSGSMTFYYTNQQSARLMFIQDRSYGITRLNVYAGEVAGYLLQDSVEQTLVTGGNITTAAGTNLTVAAGTIPDVNHTIPLFIQDKTFVPGPNQLAAEDPTWNYNTTSGSLWFPHVFMPNQNPSTSPGLGNPNPMGRWDYSPWYIPTPPSPVHGPVPNPLYNPTTAPWENAQNPGTPNPSFMKDAFMDTSVVNGIAYPYLNVEPRAYRFHIMNAANDRIYNLAWYVAASNKTMWDANGNLSDPTAGEVNMVPAYPNASIPFPGQWLTTTPDGYSGEVLDGRIGGVPDPAAIGPLWIQIGNEGGLLPVPAVINSVPVGYDYFSKNITILNIMIWSLLVAPSERADVVVDFSNFSGKTILLYNDLPNPPGIFDARTDFFTGAPDMTKIGGSPTTLPGYGPNSRTLLQIRVNNTTPQQYNLNNLKTALSAAYGASQPNPIVPESIYNAAFNTTYNDTWIPPRGPSVYFFNGGPLWNISVIYGGTGYTSAPTINISGGGGSGANATAAINATTGMIDNITITNGGTGYTFAPTVSISGGGGTGAIARAQGVTYSQSEKGILEQFDYSYGRENGVLASDLPFIGTAGGTATPYSYADPPVEYLNNFIPGTLIGSASDGTQLWRIENAGSWLHPIEFPFPFQIITEDTMDGWILNPHSNEYGWKDSLQISTAQVIFVIMRPTAPTLPFTIPKSTRLLDPTLPVSASFLNELNVMTPNAVQNYGWEYAWEEGKLGYNENELKRPFVFRVEPLTVFARNASTNSVIYNKFNSASLNRWLDLGGIFTSNISATSSGNNTTIFIRGTDNGVWTNNWNGSAWSGWTGLGGIFTSDPESVSSANGTYVFVRGADNAVWTENWNGAVWSGWTSLGGIFTSTISATSSGSNITIFTRGTDNAVWTNNWNGSAWSGWTGLGGIFTSDPESVSSANGTYVFVRGADNAVWTNNWNGSAWSGWTSLGGIFTSDISATSSGSSITIFARGTDNGVWTRSLNGAIWTTWQGLGGITTSDPNSISVSNGPYVLTRGADNAVWTIHRDGAVWSGWQNLGGTITGTPEVTDG